MQVQSFTAADWDAAEADGYAYSDSPRPPAVCHCDDCRSEGEWSYRNGYVPDDCLYKRKPVEDDDGV